MWIGMFSHENNIFYKNIPNTFVDIYLTIYKSMHISTVRVPLILSINESEYLNLYFRS